MAGRLGLVFLTRWLARLQAVAQHQALRLVVRPEQLIVHNVLTMLIVALIMCVVAVSASFLVELVLKIQTAQLARFVIMVNAHLIVMSRDAARGMYVIPFLGLAAQIVR
jgi:ABC-type tungstate transport system substrate-binding protein